MEIFRRTVKQIESDVEKGILTPEQGLDARDRADSDLDTRIQSLRDEGKQLAEALRTPAEVLKDEIARVNRLETAGAINETTAVRAIKKAQDDFEDTQDEIESQRTGPSGSFSAFAAGVIGQGANLEKDQLAEAKKTNKALNRIDTRLRNPSPARF